MHQQVDDVLRKWEGTAHRVSRTLDAVRGAALKAVAGFVDDKFSNPRRCSKKEKRSRRANDHSSDVVTSNIDSSSFSSSSSSSSPSSSVSSPGRLPLISRERVVFLGRRSLPLAALSLARSGAPSAARAEQGSQEDADSSAGNADEFGVGQGALKLRGTGGAEEEEWLQEGAEGVLDTSRAMAQGYGGAVSKAELGRCTWVFLHTLAAQFPERPTKQQQRDAKEMMMLMTRIYPCKECAEHFKQVMKANPPKTSNGPEFSQWMCEIHNTVNRSIGKPPFPCRRVDLRWGAMDCDGSACDLEGRPIRPK